MKQLKNRHYMWDAIEFLELVNENMFTTMDRTLFGYALGYLKRIQDHLLAASVPEASAAKQKNNDNNDNESSEIHINSFIEGPSDGFMNDDGSYGVIR